MNSSKLSGEKVVLAAPASSKCERCASLVPGGATTCPECGAPVGNAASVDADAEIYPELAKANLARMRGDYKQAEDQLLHVLKRYPNNPTANEMLGDLAAERQDLPHAIQWYEMALEIVPNSTSIARKLEEASAKVGTKEAKDTTAQLGLPDPSSRVPIVVGILIILFLAAITGAYFLGAKGNLTQRQLPTPINQINAVGAPASNQPAEQPKSPTATTPTASVDQQLLEQLRAKAADAAAIQSVSTDPRSNSVTVTISLPGKDDKALAARVARDTLQALSDYNLVTIRGISGDKVAYMADATRAKLTETESDQWKSDHQSDPDAWISDLLQNEWPAAPAPGEPGTQPSSETPPNSGNTSTPPTGTSDGASGG